MLVNVTMLPVQFVNTGTTIDLITIKFWYANRSNHNTILDLL